MYPRNLHKQLKLKGMTTDHTIEQRLQTSLGVCICKEANPNRLVRKGHAAKMAAVIQQNL